jgi:hypothetical protein
VRWNRASYPRPTHGQSQAEARSAARVAIGALLVALVPLGVFVAMWIPERALARGPRAEATVERVESVRTMSRGAPQTSSLTVRFTTADGEVVTTSLRSTRQQFDRTVWLTYDPASPEQVRATEGPEQSWRVPLILGLTITWFAALSAWTALRLRAGRPSRLYLRSRLQRPDDIGTPTD